MLIGGLCHASIDFVICGCRRKFYGSQNAARTTTAARTLPYVLFPFIIVIREEHGSRNGESTRLPRGRFPDSTPDLILLSSERFSPEYCDFPLSSKTNI